MPPERKPTGRADEAPVEFASGTSADAGLTVDLVERLSAAAWAARDNARILGATAVGCAALSDAGDVYPGCNVEHRFRSHDIHAETNTLSTLVAAGGDSCTHVLVVAKRDNFTPCGACLDWIFEIGGVDCWVGFQPAAGAAVVWYSAGTLMPHYPY